MYNWLFFKFKLYITKKKIIVFSNINNTTIDAKDIKKLLSKYEIINSKEFILLGNNLSLNPIKMKLNRFDTIENIKKRIGEKLDKQNFELRFFLWCKRGSAQRPSSLITNYSLFLINYLSSRKEIYCDILYIEEKFNDDHREILTYIYLISRT